MNQTLGGVDTVRRHLEKQITRINAHLTTARKVLAKKLRGNMGQARARIAAYMERRRAYQDALKALTRISPGGGRSSDVRTVRLSDDEVARVESALKLIYEVTQHGGHDISDGEDWATVEGEAEIGLTILSEARKEAS